MLLGLGLVRDRQGAHKDGLSICRQAYESAAERSGADVFERSMKSLDTPSNALDSITLNPRNPKALSDALELFFFGAQYPNPRLLGPSPSMSPTDGPLLSVLFRISPSWTTPNTSTRGGSPTVSQPRARAG